MCASRKENQSFVVSWSDRIFDSEKQLFFLAINGCRYFDYDNQ